MESISEPDIKGTTNFLGNQLLPFISDEMDMSMDNILAMGATHLT